MSIFNSFRKAFLTSITISVISIPCVKCQVDSLGTLIGLFILEDSILQSEVSVCDTAIIYINGTKNNNQNFDSFIEILFFKNDRYYIKRYSLDTLYYDNRKIFYKENSCDSLEKNLNNNASIINILDRIIKLTIRKEEIVGFDRPIYPNDTEECLIVVINNNFYYFYLDIFDRKESVLYRKRLKTLIAFKQISRKVDCQ